MEHTHSKEMEDSPKKCLFKAAASPLRHTETPRKICKNFDFVLLIS